MPKASTTVEIPRAFDESLVPVAMQMSLSRFLILKALLTGPMPLGKLAKVGQVSTAAMTGSKDALVAQGFVEEARDQEDRRSVFVSLTEKGESLVETYGYLFNA